MSFIQQQTLDDNFLLKSQYKNKSDYLQQQSTNGHWCDEIMLRAISTLTNYEIRILHHTGSITTLKPYTIQSDQSECDDRYLMLGQIGEMHYVGLNSINTTDNDEMSDVMQSETVNYDKQNTEDEDIANEIAKSPVTQENSEWPPVWSESQWREKVSKYPFLICARGRIGCMTCQKTVCVKTMASQGVSLSTEWSNCQVAPNGKDRAQMLRSLRKKYSSMPNLTRTPAQSKFWPLQIRKNWKKLSRKCVLKKRRQLKGFLEPRTALPSPIGHSVIIRDF